jgi:hypothetical protein
VIHESEAAIVRRVFEEYASGRSVRAIIVRLNAEGVPPPAARWRNKIALQAASWSVTTLRGHRRLAKGMLYNPLYIGQAIWNRSEWRRDPDTRRMTYRVRPKDDWITVEVPDLRIIPQDLWDRAQERSRRRTPAAVGLSGRFRHYLLSGFVICAVCGGAYVVKTPYSYRCGTHHARGATVCANDRPAGRKMLERTVLEALREHLFSAESMAALIAEVRARLLERQRQETDRDAAATRQKALRQLDAEIEHLKVAVVRGKATDTLLEMLEARTKERDRLRAQEPSSALAEALEAVLARLPAVVTETLEALTRSWEAGDVADGKRLLAALGTQIRLQPNGTGLEAHVSGDLERVLRLAVPRGVAGTFNSRAFCWLGEEDSNPR